MDAWVQLLLLWMPTFVLHLVRIGAFFAAQPLFGVQKDSKMLRLVLGISLATIFFWSESDFVRADNLMHLGMLGLREAAVGLALGMGARLLTATMILAGEIISHETGFSMAQLVNPETGRTSPVMSQLFEVVAFMLMFQLNVHHGLLIVFGSIYDVVPVGAPFEIEIVWDRLNEMVMVSIVYGVRYALPVLGVMVLLTATLVMLARAVQHLNLMVFSFGIRIMLALFASMFLVAEGAPFLEFMFEDILGRIGEMFSAR